MHVEMEKRWIYLSLAFIIFSIVLFLPTPEGLSVFGQRALAVFSFTIILWVTRPVSFPIIFFFISVLLVATGVFTPETAFQGIASSTIFFLIGAIILAFAVSKHGLDRRIALSFLKRFGKSPSHFLLGIILISAFLSMTMPAHGVVALLIPIVLSILRASQKDLTETNFSKSVLLSVAYASSVGSMGTLLGGARNPLAISLYNQATGDTVSFANWFVAAIPIVLVMIVFVYFVMKKVYPLEEVNMRDMKLFLSKKVEDMGSFSFGEKKSLFFLIFAFSLWVIFGNIVGMATVAVLIAGLLGVTKTLTWEDVESKIPWGIIFLYGGAITLAFALTKTGAAEYIAQNIINMFAINPYLVIFIVVVLTIFLSEVMSNAAATGTILPIALTVFLSMGLSAKMGMYVVALPSAFAFMFIIGTPGSAMVYDTGLLSARDFLKPGFILNLIGIAIFMTLGLFWWKILGLW